MYPTDQNAELYDLDLPPKPEPRSAPDEEALAEFNRALKDAIDAVVATVLRLADPSL